jgi:hypothetical protein
MRKCLLFALAICALAIPASAQVSISINAPEYGFNVLPGSVRTLNAYITNGTLNTVNWTVLATTGSASATLSASTGALPVVTVTVGSTAGSCSITGSLGSYAVTSTATVTIEAQSVDDNTKTATTTLNVCAPTTAVYIVPFYRTLYAGQQADLQSFVVGNTNLNVTWSITQYCANGGSCGSPSGGNGTLSDTTNRDTLFSATTAGRYTLTATSVADNTKSATTTMFVTGNALPSYASTPNETEPIDCSVDPAATGTDYEVGPGKTYTTIQSVPMNTMPAGSTVRIWNTDTTGVSPTTYHEYFEIGYHTSPAGTATQPMRVVGCPDSLGNLPTVDGANATGASWVSTAAAAGYGIASVWLGSSAYAYYQAGNPQSQYIIIEGLHLRHAGPSYTYTPPAGGAAVAWVNGASCINVRAGANLVFVGNDADTCTDGIFSDFNANNAWGGNVLWSLWEGNHVHGSGVNGQAGTHQAYLQGWGQVLQFNRFDLMTSGAQGGNVKLRSIGDVVRYNYIGDGALRQIDMVEIQDAPQYMTFEGYLSTAGQSNCNFSFWCLGDTMGANILAGWQEAYHQAFVYGNVSTSSTATYSHHFGGDVGATGMSNRLGYLYFYSNTWIYTHSGASILFDNSEGGGCGAIQVNEFPQFEAANNIYWTPLQSNWNCLATFIGTFTTNLLQTNWGNITTPINGGNLSGGTSFGWSNDTNAYSYPLAIPLNPHMSGISSANFLTTSTQPFASGTYAPPSGSAAIGAGTALAGAMAVMPVRFQYNAATSTVTPRSYPLTIGAVDQSTPTVANPTFSPSAGSYTGAQSVTISTSTPGATLCWQVGSPPTTNGAGVCTSGTTYTGPVSVNSSETLYAIGTLNGDSDSAVVSATYTIGPSQASAVKIGGAVKGQGSLH